MAGMPDYISNWVKMLSGAGRVDPAVQPPMSTQPASTPPPKPTNPLTGEARSSTYGKDIDLPGAPVMAMIEHLKRMGYPEDQAVRIAHDQQGQGFASAQNGAPGAIGTLASKARRE
jgi:hypothetical protein